MTLQDITNGWTPQGNFGMSNIKLYQGADGKQYGVTPGDNGASTVSEFFGGAAPEGTPMYDFDESGNYTGTRGYKNGDTGFFSNVLGLAKDIAPFALGSLAMYGATAGLGGLMGGADAAAGGAGADMAGGDGFGFDPAVGDDGAGWLSGSAPQIDSANAAFDFGPSTGTTQTPGFTASGGYGGAAGTMAGAGGIGSLFGSGKNQIGLGDLVKLGGSIYGANQTSKVGGQTQGMINGALSRIDSMYAPGSPEYNYLWKQMSAMDAAAGRDSQYGPRSVDLAGKIAQYKADAYARAVGSNAPTFMAAGQTGNSGQAGVGAALGNIFDKAGGTLTDMFKDAYNSKGSIFG